VAPVARSRAPKQNLVKILKKGHILDLTFSHQENQFRLEVRDFLKKNVSPYAADRVAKGLPVDPKDVLDWQKTLYAKGWGAPSWPKQYGGTGWSASEQSIFDEECAFANAPLQPPFGLKMVAPVLMAFGSAAQKDYFLPRILKGEDWWCQGYSEPGSGSDLASLKTKAQRAGDHYIVNGQKTWTTLAQHANMIFCLVRTDSGVRQQEGISFLLIDMKTPGVTVRPIIMIDGGHEINEVWFDQVRVPFANLVGEENKGWTYAKYLLGHERTGIAQIGRSKRELQNLIKLAHRLQNGSKGALIEDARIRDQIARLEIELDALEITNHRVVHAQDKHGVGPKASILKIKGAEIQQLLTELKMQMLGPYASVNLDASPQKPYMEHYPEDVHALTGVYFNYRKTTIYGGSNEIQKNIISKMMLDL
jgi:alkylation response protein AidB-like acyl-CoA dehydrogenase